MYGVVFLFYSFPIMSISELKALFRDVSRELNQVVEERRKLLEEYLDEHSLELFGYPPDFEKGTKGKPVDLDKIQKILEGLGLF